MSIKKWNIYKNDFKTIEKLCKEHKVSEIVATLLNNRKISDKDIEKFLFKDSQKVSDPLSYLDMDKARDRINSAIEKLERICIYGDYDVGARRF